VADKAKQRASALVKPDRDIFTPELLLECAQDGASF